MLRHSGNIESVVSDETYMDEYSYKFKYPVINGSVKKDKSTLEKFTKEVCKVDN